MQFVQPGCGLWSPLPWNVQKFGGLPGFFAFLSTQLQAQSGTGGWHTLPRIFLLTNAHNWMIPLQYVIAEGLVLLFRVADPFGFKGSGF